MVDTTYYIQYLKGRRISVPALAMNAIAQDPRPLQVLFEDPNQARVCTEFPGQVKPLFFPCGWGNYKLYTLLGFLDGRGEGCIQ